MAVDSFFDLGSSAAVPSDLVVLALAPLRSVPQLRPDSRFQLRQRFGLARSGAVSQLPWYGLSQDALLDGRTFGPMELDLSALWRFFVMPRVRSISSRALGSIAVLPI